MKMSALQFVQGPYRIQVRADGHTYIEDRDHIAVACLVYRSDMKQEAYARLLLDLLNEGIA